MVHFSSTLSKVKLAVVAPRPLLIESGSRDPIFPIDAARTTMGSLHAVYAQHGAARALEHDVFDGGHQWSGRVAYPFFEEHLSL